MKILRNLPCFWGVLATVVLLGLVPVVFLFGVVPGVGLFGGTLGVVTFVVLLVVLVGVLLTGVWGVGLTFLGGLTSSPSDEFSLVSTTVACLDALLTVFEGGVNGFTGNVIESEKVINW